MAAPCPPRNELQLLCDQASHQHRLTCAQQSSVIEQCLNRFGKVFYEGSLFKICFVGSHYCDANVNVLISKKLIDLSSLNKTIDGSQQTTERLNISTAYHVTISPAGTLTPSIATIQTSGVVSVTTTTSSVTLYSSVPTTSMAGDTVDGSPNEVSYVYPIIGCICIAIEVIILCGYFCYEKKRGVQYEKQRRPSVESGAREEVITAQTASPQKAAAPRASHVPTEEEVVQQDKDIFHSYWNLRYIDDVSAVCTPDKHLIQNTQS
ncbi:uncharacterized protein LOC128209781 isoform X2 [Mya arenaria]|nr:uncharacterized protein LOC128209781 isoform X2 [Mya arenaria]XP_052769946.1 uncharacterized protein LOC128209781 isoform X2 [Mya arenaria]XP_052769947.1 uncharacterized protein LOC128209781 isoform X2 [Mya arenaria]XP_052769948.1 uncharacterized protein LOC128209781 isoform X2 [Mya arenaria]XP_052769949.1 uncharacterized protein LOC128209781 isoform X2 [Mya arenaria]XP_052769950.1 uncharacterized protein LOC128209781 isoform X2 [Mya arenaria]